MSRKYLLGIFVFTLTSGFAAFVPTDRVANWNAGVRGGVPNRTVPYVVLDASASSLKINAAISNCPPSQYVLLKAGVYKLTGPIEINKSGVTLRGEGPGQTILKFANTSPYALVAFKGGYVFDPPDASHVKGWIGGYSQGATTITLSDVANLTVGSVLVLDQANDPDLVASTGSSDSCTYCSRASGGRVQQQYVEVVGINGNNVTISPGLYMPNWKASLTPQAWFWYGSIENSGLEDLTLDNSSSGASFNVNFTAAKNCWVKNIESIMANVAHVRTYWAKNLSIRDSYFHETKNYASQSYGVNLTYCSDVLIENNIFNTITSPIVLWGGPSGNVISYNYCTNMRYDVSPKWMAECIASHGAHPCMNLFEGNNVTSIYFDFIHGSSSHNTVFRNRITGFEPGKENNTYPVVLESKNRYLNFLGNVLGTAGYHNNYQIDIANTLNCPVKTIYRLGFATTFCDVTSGDPLVAGSLFRNGNYDVVSRQTQTAPAMDTTLPNSMVYSSAPAWWTSDCPWPPVAAELGRLDGAIPALKRFQTLSSTATNSNSGIIVGFSSAQAFVAQKVVCPSSSTRDGASLTLSRSGDFNANLTLSIYSHDPSNDRPLRQIGQISTAIATTSIPTSNSSVFFKGMSAPLLAGETYWVVLRANSSFNPGWISWNSSPIVGASHSVMSSGDGTAWTEYSSSVRCQLSLQPAPPKGGSFP